jgi:hypothetical protein
VITLPAISAALVGRPVSSVTAWVEAQGPGVNIGFVAKPLDLTTANDAFKLETSDPGVARYETASPTIGYDALDAGQSRVFGAWHHFAATWDGTAKRIYVDGVLGGTETAVLADSAMPVLLGADIDHGAVDAFYVGALDELCFWNRALDDVDVARLAAM